MAKELGCLCLVLHGHLPYVLNHGTWPHGEAWLFEAAAETYLPLLRLLAEATHHASGLTIGLTPVLLEQLGGDTFKQAFREYLDERTRRASSDAARFTLAAESTLGSLAKRWQQFYTETRAQFDALQGDIVSAFAKYWKEGRIEILTSAATHPYLPLLMTDEAITAQIKLGSQTTEHHLGRRVTGIWLPECAYRPAFDQWKPPVVFEQSGPRAGLEKFLAENGVTHFFVDAHMVENGEPIAVKENGAWRATDAREVQHDAQRGWRQQFSPVGVVSYFTTPRVFAFARHPLVSEQVWSASAGYPGAQEYLDFHRRHGERGLRFHKVTDNHGELGSKQPYVPAEAEKKAREHAEHFCSVVRRLLQQHLDYTGKPGVVTAPFDAELFGHWWFEGPIFLQHVIRILSTDPGISLLTVEQALDRYGCDKAMRLPDGSWGKFGNNSTWFNDRSQWMWEVMYRAEAHIKAAINTLAWRGNANLTRILTDAARQLLLMQASDWPFVIHSGGAVDYGMERFAGHATAFSQAMAIAEVLASGRKITAVQKIELESMRSHDGVFPEIDLQWWQ